MAGEIYVGGLNWICTAGFISVVGRLPPTIKSVSSKSTPLSEEIENATKPEQELARVNLSRRLPKEISSQYSVMTAA
jgi:hypothetical protein